MYQLRSGYFSAMLLLGLGLSGCTSATTTNINTVNQTSTEQYATVNADSEFIPPIGAVANPIPASAGERRLLLARSTDGIHFTASGEILTDQANVSDAVVEPDGTIRVYYIGQSIEADKEESTVVAISKDNGTRWTFRKLNFVNFPQPRDPSDPDVVLLADGTYRMYYTSSVSSTQFGIVYATSPDGITFTYGGESLRGPKNVVDSTTLYYNGLWHMYVLQEEVQGQLYATSTDGLTFSLADAPELRLPVERYIISNPVVFEDNVRMFGFSLADKNIRSFTSTDMETWASGDIALVGDATTTLGTNYIQDSTVVLLSDGSYLMVYVSEL